MKIMKIIGGVFLTISAPQLQANQCLKAIDLVKNQTTVPKLILLKIAKVESGVGLHKTPWPWAIQIQGKSYYFKNRSAAQIYIQKLLSLGIENFDVGCFQINWRWHKDKVRTPQELLNPFKNTAIAIQFLSELKAQHHSWLKAVSYYHSSNLLLGQKYANLVFNS